jgi:hypothetical protein
MLIAGSFWSYGLRLLATIVLHVERMCWLVGMELFVTFCKIIMHYCFRLPLSNQFLQPIFSSKYISSY